MTSHRAGGTNHRAGAPTRRSAASHRAAGTGRDSDGAARRASASDQEAGGAGTWAGTPRWAGPPAREAGGSGGSGGSVYDAGGAARRVSGSAPQAGATGRRAGGSAPGIGGFAREGGGAAASPGAAAGAAGSPRRVSAVERAGDPARRRAGSAREGVGSTRGAGGSGRRASGSVRQASSHAAPPTMNSQVDAPTMTIGAGDLALSLPTETATFSAVGTLPIGRVDTRHLLVMTKDITANEVEALAMSQDLHSGWVGASRLQLLPGAELQGPWNLDDELRGLLDLPPWAAQVMLLECKPTRSGPLPAALTGIDALSDAFPLAQPTGTELIALTRMRAMARRLAGALRLAGDPEVRGGKPRPVLITPDPETSISLTVYAPVWIAPDASATLIGNVAPGARLRMDTMNIFCPGGLEAVGQEALERLVASIGEDALDEAWRRAERQRREMGEIEDRAMATGEPIEEMRDGYAVVADVDPELPSRGVIEVRVLGTDEMPLAVRGESWASGGVVSYGVVWVPRDPADARSETISRVGRRTRGAARELIERIAQVIAGAAHGVAVDDDGFLVALE